MNLPAVRTRPFRLLDGVVVAAMALLALKVLGVMSPPAATETEPAPFAQVLRHARTNYELPDPTTTGSVAAKPAEPAPAPAAPPPFAEPKPLPPLPSAAERALLERLGDRRDELQQRAREIEAREKLIGEQERRLEERLGDVKAAEDRLGSATRTEDPALAAVKTLVVMYENMKPKEAARVFDRLPQDVLVPVVTGMNPRKMAEVLAAMTPETAEKLTVALAKRGRTPEAAAPVAALPAGELPAFEPPARR